MFRRLATAGQSSVRRGSFFSTIANPRVLSESSASKEKNMEINRLILKRISGQKLSEGEQEVLSSFEKLPRPDVKETEVQAAIELLEKHKEEKVTFSAY